MTIVDLRQTSISEWPRQIVAGYAFPPYWWLRRVTEASRQAMMKDALEQALANPQICLLGDVEDGVLTGFAQLRRLDWDSRHFGLEIYRLDYLGTWGDPENRRVAAHRLAEAVVAQARAVGAHTIQTWAPMDDIPAVHAMETAGFRTMETRVTWVFDLSRTPLPDHCLEDGVIIREHRSADAEALANLAGSAYTCIPDRFHVDPHLPMPACDDLYRQWMLNSISTDLADHIAVIEVEGQVSGYASLKYLGDMKGLCNLRLAQLLLGAVVPSLQHRGLVTQALIYNLNWLKDKTDVVHVGTMVNNIAPQIAWLKLGFRPALAGPSMHLWLDR